MLSTAYCREGTESRRPGGWRAGFRNDQGMPIPCLAHGLLARQVHGHRVTVQYPVGLTPPGHEARVPQLSSAREPKGFRNVSLTPQPCCYEINERCRNFPGKVRALFRLRIWCLFHSRQLGPWRSLPTACKRGEGPPSCWLLLAFSHLRKASSRRKRR
jgi:hypothetical protein